MRYKHAKNYFVEDRGYPTPGSALSAAQTIACHWPEQENRSFYVRDALGKPYYRVDLDTEGVVTTHTLLGWKK